MRLARLHYIMPLPKDTVGPADLFFISYSNYAIGDTAVALLKASAETDKKDVDGYLALDLAPDTQVS